MRRLPLELEGRIVSVLALLWRLLSGMAKVAMRASGVVQRKENSSVTTSLGKPQLRDIIKYQKKAPWIMRSLPTSVEVIQIVMGFLLWMGPGALVIEGRDELVSFSVVYSYLVFVFVFVRYRPSITFAFIGELLGKLIMIGSLKPTVRCSLSLTFVSLEGKSFCI